MPPRKARTFSPKPHYATPRLRSKNSTNGIKDDKSPSKSPQLTRKITRSSSNVSTKSNIDVDIPRLVTWKKPILIVHGISSEFLQDLIDIDNERLADEDAVEFDHSSPAKDDDGDAKESSSDHADHSDYGGVGAPKHRSPLKRKRGGGKPRGMMRTPKRRKLEKSVAVKVPKIAVNGGSGEASDESDHDNIEVKRGSIDAASEQAKVNEPLDGTADIHIKRKQRKPDVEADQARQHDDPAPREAEVPELLEPFEETLSEGDLPAPFRSRSATPQESQFEERAEYLLNLRYEPLTDPQAFIRALTKYPPSLRTTENLYKLAMNTQEALKAWQDQYLLLDQRTAPHGHPPKKPCHGGRVPIDPAVYEDMKEAELYNYAFDAKKPTGMQDPFAQRLGRDVARGRELRARRAARGELGEADAVSEEEGEDGSGPGKRRRKAVQRYDGVAQAARGRRSGVAAGIASGSETPDPEHLVPRRRGRWGAQNLARAGTPNRLAEIRGESEVPTSEGEGTPEPGMTSGGKRRGRPPGSKNLQKRRDAGIKKGPRKVQLQPSPLPEDMDEAEAAASDEFTRQHMALLAPAPPMAAESYPLQASESPAPAVHTGPIQADRFISHQLTPSQAAQLEASTRTPTAGPPSAPGSAAKVSASAKDRKQRVKSEKRSESMTKWWAERKAKKQMEQQQQRGGDPGMGGGSPAPFSNSPIFSTAPSRLAPLHSDGGSEVRHKAPKITPEEQRAMWARAQAQADDVLRRYHRPVNPGQPPDPGQQQQHHLAAEVYDPGSYKRHSSRVTADQSAREEERMRDVAQRERLVEEEREHAQLEEMQREALGLRRLSGRRLT